MTLTRWLLRKWLLLTREARAEVRRERLYRVIPELRDLDRQEAEYRRSHRRGAARIVRAKRDAMTKALAGATADWPKA
jgi:hypothetical protein